MDIIHNLSVRVFGPHRVLLNIMEAPKIKSRADSNEGNKRNGHFLNFATNFLAEPKHCRILYLGYPLLL